MNPLSLEQIMPYLLAAQKTFFVLCAVLYFIFSLIVVRQVTTMSKNIKDKFNSILVGFSYLHLVFAVGLILMTFFVL
jgi:hypothetical protein